MSENLGFGYADGGRLFCEGTDVPLSKLGIADRDGFDEAVAAAVAARAAEIAEADGISGHYNLDHLRRFHRALLQDVYEDAGELRTAEFEGGPFCRAGSIAEEAESVFLRLENEEYLKGLDPEDMADRLSYYTAEIERLHPFTFGNDVAEEAFFRQMCQRVGYSFDLSSVEKAELEEAKAASLDGDASGLLSIYSRCVAKIPRKRK